MFRAPDDCLQYYTGSTGEFKSFNFANGEKYKGFSFLLVICYHVILAAQLSHILFFSNGEKAKILSLLLVISYSRPVAGIRYYNLFQQVSHILLLQMMRQIKHLTLELFLLIKLSSSSAGLE